MDFISQFKFPQGHWNVHQCHHGYECLVTFLFRQTHSYWIWHVGTMVNYASYTQDEKALLPVSASSFQDKSTCMLIGKSCWGERSSVHSNGKCQRAYLGLRLAKCHMYRAWIDVQGMDSLIEQESLSWFETGEVLQVQGMDCLRGQELVLVWDGIIFAL